MNQEFDGLDLVELIDLLEEVPEPPPVAMTPQTSGWIVLGLVLLAAIVVFARWFWRRWRATAYRRAALRELQLAEDDPVQIASILRRTALVAFPRPEIASLAGEEWLAFLDRSYPGSAFLTGPGRVLATAPYRGVAPSIDLARAATDWVRRHDPAAKP